MLQNSSGLGMVLESLISLGLSVLGSRPGGTTSFYLPNYFQRSLLVIASMVSTVRSAAWSKVLRESAKRMEHKTFAWQCQGSLPPCFRSYMAHIDAVHLSVDEYKIRVMTIGVAAVAIESCRCTVLPIAYWTPKTEKERGSRVTLIKRLWIFSWVNAVPPRSN